jgi:hypothetical protein
MEAEIYLFIGQLILCILVVLSSSMGFLNLQEFNFYIQDHLYSFGNSLVMTFFLLCFTNPIIISSNFQAFYPLVLFSINLLVFNYDLNYYTVQFI